MSVRRTRARGAFLVALTSMAALGLLSAEPVEAAPPAFTTLQPGQPAHLTETIPIQVVLLGYEPEDVTEDQFDPWLHTGSRPLVRNTEYRGGHEELGLEYAYDYSFVRTDAAYEDAFFAFLTSIGVPQEAINGRAVSFPQFLYNLQETRSLDVTDNISIDAAAVEQWLVEHPATGVDPARNTVVFVNWWGRDDFRFHDYHAPRGEISYGTTADWSLDAGHTLMAWGGTGANDEESGFGRESRTWFHDLSAGPDLNTGGWILESTFGFPIDIEADYWMPPIWEYGTASGFRLHEWIGEDLALLTRFVATNLYFAPSPLYSPSFHEHRLPADIELDITVLDDDFAVPVDFGHVEQEVEELVGPVDVEVTDGRLNGLARRCLEAHSAQAGNCRPQYAASYPDPLANLFLWAEQEQRRWRDGSADYEAPAFVFSAPQVRPYQGIADDNWTTGTQSAVFATPGPRSHSLGYSTTHNLIHEYGHHFGMSHVHDGWDPEWGAYGTGLLTYIAWVGDESSTVMSYMNLTDDFSQFDLDNRHRWQAATFLRSGNAIAADILASPRAARGATALTQADAAFTAAQAALAAHDYPMAEARASNGYWLVRQAADAARVDVRASDDGWTILPPGRRTGQQPPAGPAVDPSEELAAREVTLPPELAALYPVG